MKNIIRIYRQFLEDNFDGLKLRKPLFYSWDCGLRFDLQGEGLSTRNNEYFVEVVRRATAIFETAFKPSDKVFFVFKDWRYRRRKIRFKNYAFRQIDKLNKNEIGYVRENSFYKDHNKHFNKYNVAVICSAINSINYKNILTAVGNADFPRRQPRLDNKGAFTEKEIYFVNMNTKLIFHMYDDRGLDIITADQETLRPIYKKYNDWILDYDNKRIDEQFGDLKI